MTSVSVNHLLMSFPWLAWRSLGCFYCITKNTEGSFPKARTNESFSFTTPIWYLLPPSEVAFWNLLSGWAAFHRSSGGLSSLTSVSESAFVLRQPCSSVSSLASFTVSPICGVYSFRHWQISSAVSFLRRKRMQSFCMHFTKWGSHIDWPIGSHLKMLLLCSRSWEWV